MTSTIRSPNLNQLKSFLNAFGERFDQIQLWIITYNCFPVVPCFSHMRGWHCVLVVSTAAVGVNLHGCVGWGVSLKSWFWLSVLVLLISFWPHGSVLVICLSVDLSCVWILVFLGGFVLVLKVKKIPFLVLFFPPLSRGAPWSNLNISEISASYLASPIPTSSVRLRGHMKVLSIKLWTCSYERVCSIRPIRVTERFSSSGRKVLSLGAV